MLHIMCTEYSARDLYSGIRNVESAKETERIESRDEYQTLTANPLVVLLPL